MLLKIVEATDVAHSLTKIVSEGQNEKKSILANLNYKCEKTHKTTKQESLNCKWSMDLGLKKHLNCGMAFGMNCAPWESIDLLDRCSNPEYSSA